MKSSPRALIPDREHFRKKLLAWFDVQRRDLPWRADRDPYRVWLSEIMLQQTRVAAVIGHYREFLRRFPTVEKLAAAQEASVLAAWSGLGYYRRARMLHAAAKMIVREHAGRFPHSAKALLDLPGIGRYTAAAVASIAFGAPVAVVDGNVTRVLGRLAGRPLSGEVLWTAAEELLDAKRPGDFNQAMMEFGAVVCTPRAPQCLTCPVIQMCATRGELRGTTKAAAQKKREIHYALCLREGFAAEQVFLMQRSREESLMAGMWELPELAEPPSGGKQSLPTKFKAGSRDGFKSPRHHEGLLFTLRHSITVTDYTVRVWRGDEKYFAQGKWICFDKLATVALTGLARKILRKVAGSASQSAQLEQRFRGTEATALPLK